MFFLFGALSQFHALIRVRVSGGRSVSLSEYGLEQVGTRWNHRNSMVDLQCQGQPAESPEDAASFVSDSSTEDLPESPTDSVCGVSAIRSGHGSMAGHLTPGSILSVAGSAPAVIFTAADNDNSSPLSLSYF